MEENAQGTTLAEATDPTGTEEALGTPPGIFTDEDYELMRMLVDRYRESLRNLKSNPKGMTHGDVQNHMITCDRLLG